MTDLEIQNIPILNVLPQRPPFIMITRMMHYDEKSMVTQTDVTEDGLGDSYGFVCSNGKYDDCAMIENIAQTCAARIGYYNKYILGKDVCIGYIGAVRDLRITRTPNIGETIQTSINIKSSAFGISLADAVITDLEGNILAEGEMKIALQEK